MVLVPVRRREREVAAAHALGAGLAARAFTLGELVEGITETHDLLMRAGMGEPIRYEWSVFSRFRSGALILTGSASGTGAAVEVLGSAYLAARKADAARAK